MYKDFLSSKCDIYAGVPQGSVLGPFVVLIHVAENMLSRCRLLADENSLQQSSYDMFDLNINLMMI